MPRAASGPVRGAPATVLDTLAPHAVILVRDGTVQSSQDLWLDFSAFGRETVLGAGYAGKLDGVAMYCPTATAIEIGDVFRYGDTQYKVTFVSHQGWGAVDGDTMLMAWADALQGRGV